jgi:hypothetical protein
MMPQERSRTASKDMTSHLMECDNCGFKTIYTTYPKLEEEDVDLIVKLLEDVRPAMDNGVYRTHIFRRRDILVVLDSVEAQHIRDKFWQGTLNDHEKGDFRVLIGKIHKALIKKGYKFRINDKRYKKVN